MGDRWPHELPEEVWPSFARLPWEASQKALTQESADRLARTRREEEVAGAQAQAGLNRGELKIAEETRHLWRRVWQQALGELTVESPELPWAVDGG